MALPNPMSRAEVDFDSQAGRQAGRQTAGSFVAADTTDRQTDAKKMATSRSKHISKETANRT
jgi:hypothetical protein